MSPAVAALAPASLAATSLWWSRNLLRRNTPDRPFGHGFPESTAPHRDSCGEARTARESSDVRHALIASGIFRKTDPVVVSALAGQLQPAQFPPGHVVGARSDFGGRLWVIVSGKVKVTHRHADGREIVLTILGPAEIFGATTLFDPGSCETSATTLTEVVAVPIERRRLLLWMAERPEVGDQVLRLFARWTKATTDTLVDFALGDARSRVASGLLSLRKRFGRQDGDVVRVVHDMTLTDFSRLVGVAPRTIDELLCEFEDRNWIRLEDNSVVILDAHALASMRPLGASEVRCA
jgi:CRP/FNR family cyclic AMP-dependent transcriptional regulator